MIIEIKYIFLLVAFALAEKQIDLDDIERDTLISEQRNNAKESLNTDQSQHIRPPSINAGSSYEKSSSEQSGNDVSEDIAYVQQNSDGSEEYEAQQQIQYVTPQQYEQQSYEPQVQQIYGDGHPVHEAHHTYSAPARQSLINPIVPKQNAAPSPYLAQQPRYVYVQAGQQQVSPSGVVTYAPHQRPTEQVQAQQEQDITYASVAPANSPQSQHVQVAHAQTHAQRPSATYGPPQTSYVQYLPFLAQTPNHQSYIMVLPFRSIPTHTQAIAIPPVPFTYSLRQHHGPHVSLGAIPSPTPAVGYTHSSPAEETAVLHAPEPTAVPTPSASIPYRVPPAGFTYTAAHPVTYAQQHLQVQPSIAYELPQQQSILYHHPKPLVHQQLLAPSSHYTPAYASNIDFFAPYGKQPNSLLESYVPSSVILARQRALQSRQLLHPILQNPSIHGNHQPGYNTIAYSTHQTVSYAKRSPKAVTTTNAKSATTNTSSNSNNAKKN